MGEGRQFLKYYSDVTAQNVQWLWFPYIPFGKITLVQGDPGDGKTTLMLHVVSLLSRGYEMPFSSDVMPAGNVIFQTIEDNPGDTIKPRLLREDADCGRVAFLQCDDQPLTLMSDQWEKAIRQASARILVIDPLQGYLGNDVHMQQASDMRQAMQHLTKVAERTHCAIVIIGHMNKSSGGKSLYRGLGSIDIVAAARSVLLIGRSPDNRNIRVMAQIKNSLEREGPTLAFELEENQGIRWIGQYDMTVDDILNGAPDESNTKLDKACAELKRLLQAGKQPCNTIYEAMEGESIGKRTVDLAKKLLSIVSVKVVDKWYWTLPDGGSEKL
jgi:DNA repair protein RadA/Sms